MTRFLAGLALNLMLLHAVASIALAKENPLKVESQVWGQTKDGQDVRLFTLTNDHGNTVQLIDWGATLVAVHVPDRNGNRANVTLGFNKLDGYLARHPFYGSTVGRFCNRIGKGRFSLDGIDYTLATNNGENHLHGGLVGFDAQLWQAEVVEANDKVTVRFRLTSPDGQEGYPGKLDVIADYSWDNENQLVYTFTATTDKPTVVNLTNHAYWNLGGAGSGKIYDHLLEVEADQRLDVDDGLVPTGELVELEGSSLDFRVPKPIGRDIDQLPATKGYDHCFVVRGKKGTLRAAARVVDPKSGRTMDLWTTQPGMQLYTGNHLGGNEASGGFGGHDAFCLETQHYPDAPNIPEFPSTRLNPDQTLSETTVHKFSTTDAE